MVMLSEPVKITLTGGFGKKNGRQMLKLLYFADILARSIVCVDSSDTQERLAKQIPNVSLFQIKDGPQAFVCIGKTCKPPVSDPQELKELLSLFIDPSRK